MTPSTMSWCFRCYIGAVFLLGMAAVVESVSGMQGADLGYQWLLLAVPTWVSGLAWVAADMMEAGLYLWATLVVIPLYLTYRSYRIYMERLGREQAQAREASDVQLKIIEALVLAIEAKDSTSDAHLQTLQKCAEALARAAGMQEDEIRGVQTAALLHDIGNLAVPDHILSKPAALTYEEYEKVKIHARVGAEILEAVPFPRPVAPLILAHHERWDGRGYPAGLANQDIPLGARVLAVADNFTALVSERPHRRARTLSEALEIIKQRAGKVLDPALVDSFVRILPTLDLRLGREGIKTRSGLTASLDRRPATTNGVLGEIATAHREAMALQEISQGFGSSLGVIETMNMIDTRLDKLVPFSCCVLYLWNEDNGRFESRHVAGDGAQAWQTVSVATVVELERPDAEVLFNDTPLASRLVCSLTREGRVFGAIAVYHVDSDFYTDDHRRLLQRVTQQAASVVHNAIVFDRTQEASLTDALTGLPNRRSILTHLEQELARAARTQTSVAVAMLDLDGLKQINDRFGHVTGDTALRAVATGLRGAVRPYDLCARFGGDEFVVVLWQCDVADADRKCQELQTAVSDTRHETESGDVLSLGISAGIAVFGTDGTTAEQLLAAADKRMYDNKAARRARLAADAVVAI